MLTGRICRKPGSPQRDVYKRQLKDLAAALQISDQDIAFGGTLAIAFGARGSGNPHQAVSTAVYPICLRLCITVVTQMIRMINHIPRTVDICPAEVISVILILVCSF